MKGAGHPDNAESLNPSRGESIREVIGKVDAGRRRLLGTSLGASLLAAAGGLTLSGVARALQPGAPSGRPGIGFENLPPAIAPLPDAVRVPRGYTAQLLVAWGDPILPGIRPFRGDARESAAEQLLQFGMHADGMHFFPLRAPPAREASERGILCVNNEYTHEDVLHADGSQTQSGRSIAKTRKSQAAHGVSIIEIQRRDRHWQLVRPSRYARRITANTPMRIAGPAAGHPLMRTRAFRIGPAASEPAGGFTDGRTASGTLNNCAMGHTPWGTYLTCEENWNGYFGSRGDLDTSHDSEPGRLRRRYGLTRDGAGYDWHRSDPRFDLATNPNEPHHFGWVVEIDPFDPEAPPIKRTALGRFKHESAHCVVDDDRRVAFYMGDDERNEYLYKFVCEARNEGSRARRSREMLDRGTLYVARFLPDQTGQWLPLTPDSRGVDGIALRDHPNFAGADDAEVLAKILIKTRMAADAVGATMMDRPEWTAARPRGDAFGEIEVYCTLTNNNRRGTQPPSTNAADGSTEVATARPGVDAANPREDNVYGHIIRWREVGRSVAATSFHWELFVQCGDTRSQKAPRPTNDYHGNIIDSPAGSADYGAPDGLTFDRFGRLWVQTDQAGDGKGDWENLGANMMVCVDPATGETRRFLTGPPRCEVTGMTMTPDGRTMFVGIQHPGEGATAADPTAYSAWPQSQWSQSADGRTPLPPGRPRSGVVVITRDDGGIIGA